MDADRLRKLLLPLPHVVETMQWGDCLVFWAGDKSVGGKMFAIVRLDARERGGTDPVLSFAAGPEAYPTLLEIDGLIPAPYLARAHWVAALHWNVFLPSKWKEHLYNAYTLTLAKLAPKTRRHLALEAAPSTGYSGPSIRSG